MQNPINAEQCKGMTEQVKIAERGQNRWKLLRTLMEQTHEIKRGTKRNKRRTVKYGRGLQIALCMVITDLSQ